MRSCMKCTVMFGAMLVLLIGGVKSAKAIPLSDLLGCMPCSIIVGDFVFSDFSTSGPAPDLSEVDVSPILGPNLGGLNFTTPNLTVNAGDPAINFGLHYDVTNLNPIVGAELSFVASATGDGAEASITERLRFTGVTPCAGGVMDPPLRVSFQDGTFSDRCDAAVPLTSDIDTEVIFLSPGEGSASITEFSQTFSQVPEPSTYLLFATGLLGIIGYGWRRRKLNG